MALLFSFDLAVEITGFFLGLLYLWWEYHADSRLWLVSAVMPAVSMWVYFSKGLYADFSISVYYLLITLYGYRHWRRRHDAPGTPGGGPSVPVTHIGARPLGGALVVFAALWFFISFVLRRFTNSNVPLCDAFTTALSIVAMWLLARKHVEQWLAWIVVDVVSVGLYCYKGIYFYAALNVAYTLVACFGYRKWLRMMPPRP